MDTYFWAIYLFFHSRKSRKINKSPGPLFPKVRYSLCIFVRLALLSGAGALSFLAFPRLVYCVFQTCRKVALACVPRTGLEQRVVGVCLRGVCFAGDRPGIL